MRGIGPGVEQPGRRLVNVAGGACLHRDVRDELLHELEAGQRPAELGARDRVAAGRLEGRLGDARAAGAHVQPPAADGPHGERQAAAHLAKHGSDPAARGRPAAAAVN